MDLYLISQFLLNGFQVELNFKPGSGVNEVLCDEAIKIRDESQYGICCLPVAFHQPPADAGSVASAAEPSLARIRLPALHRA
jgi:hypothetical protein